MGALTRVWAHRGASGYAPENTMPAFELALDQGADGVELDVQLSRDGALVVIHDETLDRTTDGTGRVVDHTLDELRRWDARNGMPGYASTPIPTLDEVLTLLAPASVWINIELKNSEEPYPGLEQKVIAAVRDHGIAERVTLSSFSDASVGQLHGLAPDLELATLYTRPQLRPWRTALRLGARAVHPPAAFVPGRLWVRRAQSLGLAVRPWIVNSPQLLERMFRWRVNAVFTDTPDVARELRWRA
ncbi:MAG: glycerophosphodiester phosphodiesterase [Propionibacteriaceae bacterium]|nr:glycerophosphodiester phosphodiesterase [Propionibacteriaceae bacterium]